MNDLVSLRRELDCGAHCFATARSLAIELSPVVINGRKVMGDVEMSSMLKLFREGVWTRNVSLCLPQVRVQASGTAFETLYHVPKLTEHICKKNSKKSVS